MIRRAAIPHHVVMAPAAVETDGASAALAGAAPAERTTAGSQTATDRLRKMMAEHFDFIWRCLRRFGLDDSRADDAVQQVFVIAADKLESIAAGSERSFLIGTAMRVASDVRRSAAYRREVPCADVGIDIEDGVQPDDLVDQLRARRLLDSVLDGLDLELRSVLVLFEIEQLTVTEIASLLRIPRGTVASRLRRARAHFEAEVGRLRRGNRGTRGKPGQEGGR